MPVSQPAGLSPAAVSDGGSQPSWGLFVGGLLLGSTVAAGAAYLAVRYASNAAAAEEYRRAVSARQRRLGR